MSILLRDIPYHPGIYPRDRTDPKEWDGFWTDVLDLARTTTTGHSALLVWRRGPICPPFNEAYQRRIQQLRQWGFRRVLFPGNGLRVLPEFVRDLGMEVTALDFSEVPTQYTADHPASAEERDQFYSVTRRAYDSVGRVPFMDVVDPDATEERTQAFASPGGTLAHVAGDLRDIPETVVYDAAFVLNLLQVYPDEEQKRLLEKLSAALSPGGVLLIQDIGFYDQDAKGKEAFSANLRQAGFITEFADVDPWERTLGAQAEKRLAPERHKKEREERRRDSEARAWLQREKGQHLAVFLPV